MVEKKLTTLSDRPSYFGADPELFFTKKGKVIGSEKVIPEETHTSRGKIIRDGVQAELNPNSTFCRAIFGNNYLTLFTYIKNILSEKGNKDVKLSWEQVIEITQEELDSLSPKSRKFGCMPSFNIYLPENDNISEIKDNPATYLYRGAGGHIHVDFSKITNTLTIDSNGQSKYVNRKLTYEEITRFVKTMDIVVGNTCVILDRHPLSTERRRNYGKAGEYRLPSYGIEYRTLSNFWLRHYQLMSMTYGLMIMAYRIANSKPHYDKLIELVEQEDIINAINNNDLKLAKSNFNKVKEFLAESMDGSDNDSCFDTVTLKYFEHFLKKGLDYWFNEEKKSFIDQWTTEVKFYPGFEKWLVTVVKADRDKE